MLIELSEIDLKWLYKYVCVFLHEGLCLSFDIGLIFELFEIGIFERDRGQHQFPELIKLGRLQQ